jgi:dimethylhistidine N-methyltransferase
MNDDSNAAWRKQDVTADGAAFAKAALEGLSQPQKFLPSRYLYDARGSELFEEITRLPEYYQTRTEASILETNAGEMTQNIPDGAMLLEFGSGSSLKTEILLRHMPSLRAYVAIDVSPAALEDARARLSKRFPQLQILTVVGDFGHPVELPSEFANVPAMGFFPGSTIGNLTPAQAVPLLRTFRTMLSPKGSLIIGVDNKKDPTRLVQAYDDAAGVTAAFNLNVLTRMNRELSASIDIAAFAHRAIYNPDEGRVEMHLVSTRPQKFALCGRMFRLRAGEFIHTENSYKYTDAEFRDIARAAGWSPRQVWSDQNKMFSVHELCLVS